MPALDESAYIGKRTSSSQVNVTAVKLTRPTPVASPSLPNGVAHAPINPLLDLLDLTPDDKPVPTLSTNDIVQDLLGIGLGNPSTSGLGFFTF